MVARRVPPPDDRARELRALLARGRFHEVVEVYRALGEEGVRPSAAVVLLAATAATRMGDLTLGATLAVEALDALRVHPDDDSRMRAVNLLGAISFDLGELEVSQRRFDEALRIAEQLQDSLMMARTANNLASVAHLRGDVANALSLYRTALLGYQRLGARHFIAETYHNFGVVFRQEEDWVSARNHAVQAVRHAEIVGEPSLLALAISGRAEIDLARGELELSAQGIERAAQLTAEAGDDIGQAEVRRLRATLALRAR